MQPLKPGNIVERGLAPRNQASGRDAVLLLKGGVWLLAAGTFAILLIHSFFGGIGQYGAHSNSGWLLLVTALACLPLGLMAFALGFAKWLKKRRS
jgi:hypothetical protein